MPPVLLSGQRHLSLVEATHSIPGKAPRTCGRQTRTNPNCEEDEGMLQTARLPLVEIGEEFAHLLIGDEARGAFLLILLNVPAGIGTIRPIAPQLGEVEHLAQQRERAISDDRTIRQRGHPLRDVGASDFMNLHPPQARDDVVLDVHFVAFDSARLVVVQLRIVFDELRAHLLHVGAARADDFSALGSRPCRTSASQSLREVARLST